MDRGDLVVTLHPDVTWDPDPRIHTLFRSKTGTRVRDARALIPEDDPVFVFEGRNGNTLGYRSKVRRPAGVIIIAGSAPSLSPEFVRDAVRLGAVVVAVGHAGSAPMPYHYWVGIHDLHEYSTAPFLQPSVRKRVASDTDLWNTRTSKFTTPLSRVPNTTVLTSCSASSLLQALQITGAEGFGVVVLHGIELSIDTRRPHFFTELVPAGHVEVRRNRYQNYAKALQLFRDRVLSPKNISVISTFPLTETTIPTITEADVLHGLARHGLRFGDPGPRFPREQVVSVSALSQDDILQLYLAVYAEEPALFPDDKKFYDMLRKGGCRGCQARKHSLRCASALFGIGASPVLHRIWAAKFPERNLLVSADQKLVREDRHV